jgi:hypothetical protein
MTQAELDALPEDGQITTIDGRPHMQTVGALWTSYDEPCRVVDANGQAWAIGWAKGVKYKRRTHPLT